MLPSERTELRFHPKIILPGFWHFCYPRGDGPCELTALVRCDSEQWELRGWERKKKKQKPQEVS